MTQHYAFPNYGSGPRESRMRQGSGCRQASATASGSEVGVVARRVTVRHRRPQRRPASQATK